MDWVKLKLGSVWVTAKFHWSGPCVTVIGPLPMTPAAHTKKDWKLDFEYEGCAELGAQSIA